MRNAARQRLVTRRLVAWGAFIGFALLLAGCPDSAENDDTQSPTAALDQQALNTLLKDAVVLIEVDLRMPDGTISGGGSGFVVNNRGRIITNAHVVSPSITDEVGNRHVASGRSVRVVFHPATNREETLQAEVVRENEDLDLALLRVNKETPTFLELGDATTAAELTRIVCAGHPAGLREISLRTGVITAHRTFEGKKWLEHDAEAEWGNGGGPVVNEAGEVVGVMTRFHWNQVLASKWAVPANTLRDWLAAEPADDPPVYFASADGRVPVTEGDRPQSNEQTELERLLASSGLLYSYGENDSWQIAYDNDATVYVQEFDDILRAWVLVGELPAGASIPALAFTFHDPIGRLSVNGENGIDGLYWEAQVPMGVASPQYLRELCDIGANQAANFLTYISTDMELETPTELYPGGDPEELQAQLENILEQSDLIYESADEGLYKIPFDNEVSVYVKVFNGVAYVHSYTGGLPGSTEAEMDAIATDLLRMNWSDPIGRLAVDQDIDVVWECQVPMSYLTPDYLYVVASIGSGQVEAYWDRFGRIPFNG